MHQSVDGGDVDMAERLPLRPLDGRATRFGVPARGRGIGEPAAAAERRLRLQQPQPPARAQQRWALSVPTSGSEPGDLQLDKSPRKILL